MKQPQVLPLVGAVSGRKALVAMDVGPLEREPAQHRADRCEDRTYAGDQHGFGRALLLAKEQQHGAELGRR